jgi:hypothetical protein
MEINISRFYNFADASAYSASRAEIGENAGAITWDNAINSHFTLLDNEEKLDAMRTWAKSSGGWDDDEIAAWTDDELNALFIQLVSGDIREMREMDGHGLTWAEYQERAEAGQVSGALFKGTDGRIYYYLGE